ncbi:MAG: DinB family protein [Luteibaculum sp.]
MKKQALIEELKGLTASQQARLIQIKKEDATDLNFKPSPDSWSALECIAHLNYYGNFYIPEVRARLEKSIPSEEQNFKSGLLGNYFAQLMKPEGKKMKTFKAANPAGSSLDNTVLTKFEQQLNSWLEILNSLKQVNLNKVKTSTSLSKWIKLKLGDTLRVVIYHNERHLQQAEKAILAAKSTD